MIARWVIHALAAAAVLAVIVAACWQAGLAGGILAVVLLSRIGVL